MAIMELKGVGKSYARHADEICVLRDIELAIEEGEFLAIVGFSGSGKTTLMSLLAGLEPSRYEGLPSYDGGDALFDGRILVRLRPRSGRPRP